MQQEAKAPHRVWLVAAAIVGLVACSSTSTDETAPPPSATASTSTSAPATTRVPPVDIGAADGDVRIYLLPGTLPVAADRIRARLAADPRVIGLHTTDLDAATAAWLAEHPEDRSVNGIRTRISPWFSVRSDGTGPWDLLDELRVTTPVSAVYVLAPCPAAALDGPVAIPDDTRGLARASGTFLDPERTTQIYTGSGVTVTLGVQRTGTPLPFAAGRVDPTVFPLGMERPGAASSGECRAQIVGGLGDTVAVVRGARMTVHLTGRVGMATIASMMRSLRPGDSSDLGVPVLDLRGRTIGVDGLPPFLVGASVAGLRDVVPLGTMGCQQYTVVDPLGLVRIAGGRALVAVQVGVGAGPGAKEIAGIGASEAELLDRFGPAASRREYTPTTRPDETEVVLTFGDPSLEPTARRLEFVLRDGVAITATAGLLEAHGFVCGD